MESNTALERYTDVIEINRPSNIVEVKQGSIDWLLLRCGKITASRVAEMMKYLNEVAEYTPRLYPKKEKCSECNESFTAHEWLVSMAGEKVRKRVCSEKCKDAYELRKPRTESAARYEYKIELVTERLTGVPVPAFVSKEMQWGTDNEPIARTEYEMHIGALTDQVGFVQHPTMDFFGASPDSLVAKVGGVEIKCPNTTTHIKWMQAGIVPEEHQEQMLSNLACNPEREWWDFMSFDPRLPEHLKKFIVRMYRDEKRIKEIEAEAVKFNGEIISLIQALPQAA